MIKRILRLSIIPIVAFTLIRGCSHIAILPEINKSDTNTLIVKELKSVQKKNILQG